MVGGADRRVRAARDLALPQGHEPLTLAAEAVTYERVGAAAVVTIDRQERRNAVDGPTADLLTEAYRALRGRRRARA